MKITHANEADADIEELFQFFRSEFTEENSPHDDDFSIVTSNGINLSNIVPNCESCSAPCSFFSLKNPIRASCSRNSKCRSSRNRSYEFMCKACPYTVCLLCSMVLPAVHAVDKFVGTANNLTKLCGNTGRFEVS
jgi:hypothetical protein